MHKFMGKTIKNLRMVLSHYPDLISGGNVDAPSHTSLQPTLVNRIPVIGFNTTLIKG